jgi:DnaK suppressor protein
MNVSSDPHLQLEALNQLKHILLSELERLQNKPKQTRSITIEKSETTDPLDEAQTNEHVGQELRFQSRDLFYQKKIHMALERIDKGLYGECLECGTNISLARLKARPTAELCIQCKEESELIEKNNAILQRSKSLGKSLQDL